MVDITCGLALASALFVEIICVCESMSKPQPKAMDVYQGKTAIEYTIRDGIKIDSVVVWKEEVK